MENELILGFRFLPYLKTGGYYILEVYLKDSWEKVAYLETVPCWIPNELETGLENDPEHAKVWMVEVREDYRRKGIASAMYEKAERDLNRKLVQGDVVTNDGQKFKRKT